MSDCLALTCILKCLKIIYRESFHPLSLTFESTATKSFLHTHWSLRQSSFSWHSLCSLQVLRKFFVTMLRHVLSISVNCFAHLQIFSSSLHSDSLSKALHCSVLSQLFPSKMTDCMHLPSIFVKPALQSQVFPFLHS